MLRLLSWLLKIVGKILTKLVPVLWTILRIAIHLMAIALASLWTGIPTALDRAGKAAVKWAMQIRLPPSKEKIVYVTACVVSLITILLGWLIVAHLTVFLFWLVF